MTIVYYVPERIEHLSDGTIDCLEYDEQCMTLAEAREICKWSHVMPQSPPYNSIVKLSETDDGDIEVLDRRVYRKQKPRNAFEAFAMAF